MGERTYTEAYWKEKELELQAAERVAIIQGLRELADFLESHPRAPLPYLGSLNAFVAPDENLAEVIRGIGSADKEFVDRWFNLKKTFGPVSYEVCIQRERVCERKIVGTRTIPARTEDVVEWTCKESLLAPEAAIREENHGQQLCEKTGGQLETNSR